MRRAAALFKAVSLPLADLAICAGCLAILAVGPSRLLSWLGAMALLAAWCWLSHRNLRATRAAPLRKRSQTCRIKP